MQASKNFLHWVTLQLLAFFFTPFSFALAGLLAGILVSVEPYVFGVRSPLNSRFQPYYNQGIYLLSPLVTGLVLGTLSSVLQSVAMRKVASFRMIRWVIPGALGMAAAFLAFAWAYSGNLRGNLLLLASIFSAAVYGLATSLPQSHVLKKHLEITRGWIIACTLGGILAFPLICTPVWLPEGKAYFWLIFPLCAIGGILFGVLTGIQYTIWLNNLLEPEQAKAVQI